RRTCSVRSTSGRPTSAPPSTSPSGSATSPAWATTTSWRPIRESRAGMRSAPPMRAEDRDRGPARPGVLEAAAFEARSGEVDLPPDALLNMELSVLAFNRRVLELAMDPGTPLLERVRFIAILGSNLDEFFMTRVAGFKRQLALGHGKRTLDGRTPQEQLDMIGVVARELLRDAYETVIPRLFAEVAAQGIQVLSWTELAPEEKADLRRNDTSELDAVINPVPLLRGGR